MKNNRNPSRRHHSRADKEAHAASGDEHTDINTGAANENRQKKKNTALEKANFALLCLVFVASATAAYFTGQQWRTADDQERRQLRAYVGIVPIGIENFGDKDKQIFAFHRHNYGATPAYDLTFTNHGGTIIPQNTPVNITVAGPPPGGEKLFTLFPTMDVIFRIVGTLAPKEQLNMVAAGTHQIVYFGTINYTDAFRAKHFTRYCWMFSGPDMSAKAANACLTNNDSD